MSFRAGSWDWGVMEVWGVGEGAQKGPEAGHSERRVAPPERTQREQWGVRQPGRLVEGEGWGLAWEALQTEGIASGSGPAGHNSFPSLERQALTAPQIPTRGSEAARVRGGI